MPRRAPGAALLAALLAAPMAGGCRSVALIDALEGTVWRGVTDLTPLYEDDVLVGEPYHTGIGIRLELEPGGEALIRLEKLWSGSWQVREGEEVDQIDLGGFDGSDGLGVTLVGDPDGPDGIEALEFTDQEGRVTRLEPAGDADVDLSELAGAWRSEATWPHPDEVDVQSTLSIAADGSGYRGDWGLALPNSDSVIDWMSGPAEIWTRGSDGKSFWTVDPFDGDGGPVWWIFGGEIDLESGILYGPVDIDPDEAIERYAAYALTPDG